MPARDVYERFYVEAYAEYYAYLTPRPVDDAESEPSVIKKIKCDSREQRAVGFWRSAQAPAFSSGRRSVGAAKSLFENSLN